MLNSKIVLPDYLYHGTVHEYITGFADKLINLEVAGWNKDFGTGLYTTVDFRQASEWARSISRNKLLDKKFIGNATPCVIVIKVEADKFGFTPDILTYQGESREWSNFILEHRFRSDLTYDPCASHPDIVCGPLADNDTGTIIREFRDSGRHIDFMEDQIWFQDMITYSSKNKRHLNGLDLGDQVAFFNECLNKGIRFAGYCLFDEDTGYNKDDVWEGWKGYVRYS